MEWLIYLLKVSACLGLFYVFYHFCLQKLTFFSVNRIYLLSTLMISFVIPALQLEVQRSAGEAAKMKENLAVHTSTFTDLQNPGAEGKLFQPRQADEGLSAIDWPQLFSGTYWLVAVLMLIIFLFQIVQLLRHTRQVNQRIGLLKVVFKPDGFTNCSFLNYVFVNQQELSEEELHVILQHEQVHVSRYHSVDKLLMSACKVLLWFNPLVYLYDKALEQVHEYEADKETSMAVGNVPYAGVLLAVAVKKGAPALAHSFVQNPVKERIKMLFTNQSTNMKKLTYLAVLPIGLALTWTFAVQVVYANDKMNSPKQQFNKPVAEPADIPLEPAKTNNELKDEELPAGKVQSDTLRMIDGASLGKNPEVIIDGKSYDAGILTKISPRCTKAVTTYVGKIEITTINNKIEYATAIDRENVKARNKARSLGKFYVRYPARNENGKLYDEIYIKLETSSGSVGLPTGSKLLLLIDGKQYSEQQAKTLTAGQFKGLGVMITRDISADAELKAKYGEKYQALIEISGSKKDAVSDTTSFKLKSGKDKIFRRPMGMEVDDAYGKFSYSAQDSTIYQEGLKYVTLYGGVKMNSEALEISADKIKFNGTTHIALARNVSFIKKGNKEPIKAPFVRFDMHKGSYEILPAIKEL